MSDLPTKPFERLFDALGPWPIVQFAAAAVIIYFVLRAMMRGEKDRKAGEGGESAPRWFTDQEQLRLLRDIRAELRQQTQLLEMMANENVINPRRLQE